MKQFIYLDTDIISSIIAQSEQGIVTQAAFAGHQRRVRAAGPDPHRLP